MAETLVSNTSASPISLAAAQETRSTCCYCGVGCGVIIEHKAGQITGVRGDPDHPANFGRLCTKGSTLHLTMTPDSLAVRALYPELRTSRDASGTNARTRTDWNTALDHAADKFAAVIREHGPDAVAFYISGQLLTEDYYVFNKLAKGLIGTNNVDTNSRLCMSSAVVGYKQTLGADSPPACYDDVKHTDCLFLAGSNTAFAHPILFRRIEDARAANPAMKMIVVDPRRTDTAEQADLHLALLPGTDIALYNAMLHVMLWEEWIKPDYIAAHTEGFDALKRTVRAYTPEMAAEICGLTKKEIETAAEWFATSKATMSMYCMGLNQSTHGTHNNAALINLHLATAQIGKPGAGPFSLTGQPNAMGGREVGGLSNLLSGHRDLTNADHRAEVARLWGIADVPEKPGLSAVELFDAMAAGTVKAVWISCTNPAQSMPDQNLVHKALQTCDFVVVQEAYRNTETARFADLLLPATSWGEKTGTVTNSERRISRVIQAVPAPGEARHDWDTAIDFARRLGQKIENANTATLFPYANEEEIWNEHRESTRGRDLDITGLSYAMLEQKGPQQWPFPQGAESGKVRLYEDGIYPTASGRAKFVAAEHKDTAEKADARYPIRMTTGRLRDQWHGMSRTGTVARLYAHEAEPMIHLNPVDLDKRGMKDGDLARVKSRRGEIIIKVLASESVRIGQAFLPMHWGGNAMSGAGANALTLKTFDPFSKQPELKHSAVQFEKYKPSKTETTEPKALVAMRRMSSESNALQLMEELREQIKEMPQASLTLAGRDTPVVILKALTEALTPEAERALDVALSLADDFECVSYRDVRRDIAKRARVVDNKLAAVRLTGEVKAASWLQDMMVNGGAATEARKWLLAPLAEPPAGNAARGKIICNCFDVSENEISAALRTGESLEQVQARTRCGTNCGSCVPELKRIAFRAGS
ncbi:MAG TPA: molybdopterin-dependent oxidoreductase [Rhodocyclaceae bacterium]|nr:molybdopterin-dependent oxidoreductase [Rhodocyclaceae bacterium]